MTCVIEHLQLRWKGVRRSGLEPHVLNTMYNELLLVAITNMYMEGLTCLRLAISTAGNDVVQLKVELQVCDASIHTNLLKDGNRRYILAVYFRQRRLSYIFTPPAKLAQYILVHLARFMDMYIGYFSRCNRLMTLFSVTDAAVPSSEDYATSAN